MVLRFRVFGKRVGCAPYLAELKLHDAAGALAADLGDHGVNDARTPLELQFDDGVPLASLVFWWRCHVVPIDVG